MRTVNVWALKKQEIRNSRMEDYLGHFYCPKDDKFISPIRGEFLHPHHGRCTCYVCPKCGGKVFLKKQVIGGNYAI